MELIQIASGVAFAATLLLTLRHLHRVDMMRIADDIAFERSQHEWIDSDEHGRA